MSIFDFMRSISSYNFLRDLSYAILRLSSLFLVVAFSLSTASMSYVSNFEFKLLQLSEISNEYQ